MSNFPAGSKIKVTQLPPYLKTADPMPMLRPADLIAVGDIGTVRDRRPGDYWAIKFERGSFLLEEKYFELFFTLDVVSNAKLKTYFRKIFVKASLPQNLQKSGFS